MSYYIHSVPGRLRVKIPVLKKNRKVADNLRLLLKDMWGIQSVAVSTVTGSVVIRHDPEVLSSNGILSLLSREGYIDLTSALPNNRHLDAAFDSIGQAASKALIGFALDRAFQGTPLAILTALI